MKYCKVNILVQEIPQVLYEKLLALLFRRISNIKPDEEPCHRYDAVCAAISLTSVPPVVLVAALPAPASHPST